ncbi:hypothetical protein [Streptomyces rubiginosohelvolus]|uniref:hypothetical protein n=1 Tax=Streptomyces rubiginosohelvolus TaxID=67362 RepID=UPI0035DAA655
MGSGSAAASRRTLASLGAGVGTAALGSVFALSGRDGAQAVTDGTRTVLAVSAALAVVGVITAVTLVGPRRVPARVPAREGGGPAPAGK